MAGINDITRDENGNFEISGGDFVFKDQGQTLMRNILIASPGHYKEFPTVGARLIRFVNSNANKQVVARAINVALTGDVFKKPQVDLSDFPSKIKVNNLELELVQDEL